MSSRPSGVKASAVGRAMAVTCASVYDGGRVMAAREVSRPSGAGVSSAAGSGAQAGATRNKDSNTAKRQDPGVMVHS
ncbi:hypothetical protein VZQ01_12840 [Myxococcus faecalis]|uniref:hypothetical protein n=1 Tax=Myxococcus faecalis TaxID=3115646 RepID=UPI003CE92512